MKLIEIMLKYRHYLVSADNRKTFMFYTVNILLSLVALVMSVHNIITEEPSLTVVTLGFSILCALNVLVYKKSNKAVNVLFILEFFGLMTYCIISGNPDGFSILWTCAVPMLLIPMYGIKTGGIISAVMLCEIVFFFMCNYGQSTLMVEYSKEFIHRFPLYYIMVAVTSLVLEYIKSLMQIQLVEEKERFNYLYRHDALTGAMNRHGFNEIMDKYFNESGHAAVFYLDFDDFKRVNDIYGHIVGDQVLAETSAVIESLLCDCCSLCRFGGEEFAILMTCDHDPLVIGEEIVRGLENSVIKSGDDEIKVTCSIGIAVVNDTTKVSPITAINTADKCLYKAKQCGKNCVVHEYI